MFSAFLYAADAKACGPCATPELWDVQDFSGEAVVVSNFGLFSLEDGTWQLTCEEAIGGLLLGVLGHDAQNVVSTDAGLFVQDGNACEWSSGPATASNDWALSFSGGAPRERFALVIDAQTQELHVERSLAGEDFTIIHSFANTSGYRELESGGDPGSVFIGGYTYAPRTWNLAYSVDAGETWDEVSPAVDNAYASMTLGLVDPEFPRAVYIQAETVAGVGHELWRFDGDTNQIEMLFRLEEGELLTGLTLSGDTLWVAGRHRGGGSLYRADRAVREFSRVVDSGPEFGCLAEHDGILYACVNDFTYASEFILGASTDEGQSWQPRMTVEDLANIEGGCGEVCAETTDWLQGTFGVLGAGGADPGGAGASGMDGGEPPDGAPRPPSGGGCQLAARTGSPSTGSGWLCLVLPLVFLYLGRRRRAAIGILAASAALSACADDPRESQGDADSLPTPADCAGRGEDLSDLRVESDDLQLSMIEYSPDPPTVGDNSWLVELSDHEGKALSGLADGIIVTPFMPDHGHGTPVPVGVEESADGEYRLAPINTFMPGLWQVGVEVEGDVLAFLEFGVCVE